ncbi:uncharacterized protein Fot_49172 [Forsythia ovata]|uniref:Uncharacterized protein n=1 Tax=Forsythia ovata TaxID=205694 RepID=A0ABD1QB42_9LAMI
MVSDQEIAEGVETLLRQSDPGSFTSLSGVVQQLEAKLGPQPRQILHPHFVIQQQPYLFHHQHNSSPPPTQVHHRQPQPLPKGGADARKSSAMLLKCRKEALRLEPKEEVVQGA